MDEYSQLPVMQGLHDVKGMVSWKSIGEVHARGRSPQIVRECMVEAHEVCLQEPLANAADAIYRHDYVLVRGEERAISGIVTAVDLAYQFKQLAHPFLSIGEIEHHLRNWIRRAEFRHEEFVAAMDGDEEAESPDDLTLGGICRLLQPEDRWTRLGLEVDRSVFMARLESVRRIRNDVMHFSPEPREPSEIRELEYMARFCRTLARA